MKRQDAAKIYSLLCKQYPDARDSPAMLSKGSAFEVLILTILSAQTTDRAVLQVKKPLFSKYPTPSVLAQAKPEDVETDYSQPWLFSCQGKAHHCRFTGTVVRIWREGARVHG